MEARTPVKPADEELVFGRSGDLRLSRTWGRKTRRTALRSISRAIARSEGPLSSFLRAYTHLGNFDGRSGFYTWFYRILVNVCLDYKRRKKRTFAEEFNEAVENQVEPSQVSPKPSSPDQQVLAGQLSRKVNAALEGLPPKQRTAFILKNNQGLSIKEIAEMMQTAEGTVKVHLHRAVTALRQSLAEFA
jgi:RNA polymerase sigma-70 factor (ECF subfamily)